MPSGTLEIKNEVEMRQNMIGTSSAFLQVTLWRSTFSSFSFPSFSLLYHRRIDPTAHRRPARPMWEEPTMDQTAHRRKKEKGKGREHGREKEIMKRKIEKGTRRKSLHETTPGSSRKLFLDVQRICF